MKALLSRIFNPKISIKGIPLILYRGDKTQLLFTIQYRNNTWYAGWVDPEHDAWISRLTYFSKDLDDVSETIQRIIKYQVDTPDGKYFTKCPAEIMNIEYDREIFTPKDGKMEIFAYYHSQYQRWLSS